jgi:cob(I)alamin adenosyltransferase
MSIVTKTGDGGTTGRFGGGRISKSNPRIEAIGSVDELNSSIGLMSARTDLGDDVLVDLKLIQGIFFTIGSMLSLSPEAKEETKEYVPNIQSEELEHLERRITELEAILTPQRKFILPGGAPSAAMSFWIRSLARKAERRVVEASEQEAVDESILKYLNRVSDYFYILARYLNMESGVGETEWQGGEK